jgi:hypothetical protein
VGHLSFSPASSDSSTEEDGGVTDTASQQNRGRRYSQNGRRTILRDDLKKRIVSSKRGPSGQNNNSSSGKSERSSPGIPPRGRESFTRSRSPAILTPIDMHSGSVPFGPPSQSAFARYRGTSGGGLLPAALQLQFCFPFTCIGLRFHIDTRKAGESLLLLGSLIYASKNLSDITHDDPQLEGWISIGIYVLFRVSDRAYTLLQNFIFLLLHH